MSNLAFLKMIERLRREEEVILYDRILTVQDEESAVVIDFLRSEYQRERTEYPPGLPEFDQNAAIWAARTVYVAAQLMLYRQHHVEDLLGLLPGYSLEKNDSAILSADLCLRFLPHIIRHLKAIDSEDPLIELLRKMLQQWPYSFIGDDDSSPDGLSIDSISYGSVLMHLYCARIIELRNIKWSQHSVFNEAINAEFGIYSQDYWKDFRKITPQLPI